MDGYTRLTLGGKDFGIKFGYLSFKLITQDKNRSVMFDEDGNPNEIGVAKIIYSGYVNNCVNKNTEAIDFDDFSKLFDKELTTEGAAERFTEVIKVWTDSSDVRELIEKNQEKKSLNGEDSTLTNSSQSVSESLESAPGNLTE